MILTDILLALALSGIFVAVLLETSVEAHALFKRAQERNGLIDIYVSYAHLFEEMMPYENRTVDISVASSTISIVGKGKWFGNDRIETEIYIDSKVTFSSVRPYPFEDIEEAYKTPICSVNFSRGRTISIDPITLPIDPLIPLTDLEVRNNIAYISTDSTKAADPDIVVVDISTSSTPRILSSLNTGPGIASFSFVNDRIYAAARSTAAQLHLIRIRAPDDLFLEKKYTLSLPSTTTPPTVASSILYAHNHIYLGTEKWNGDEMAIFDVSQAPDLVWKSGIEIGSMVMDIAVREKSMYVASAAEKQLSVVDIKDIEKPTIVNVFSPSGWSRQEGKAISIFEDTLKLARTSGGFDIRTDYELFTWASTSLSSFDNPTVLNMPYGVYGIVSDRIHTYVVTREPGHELQILSHMSPTSTTYSLPHPPQVLTCDNDHLYVLANTSPVIYELSFQ